MGDEQGRSKGQLEVTWVSLDTVFPSRFSFLALLGKAHTQVP